MVEMTRQLAWSGLMVVVAVSLGVVLALKVISLGLVIVVIVHVVVVVVNILKKGYLAADVWFNIG